MVVPTINLPDPSICTFDSAFKVFAVPEPVITLLSALLFIVVPDALVQLGAEEAPPEVKTCPLVP